MTAEKFPDPEIGCPLGDLNGFKLARLTAVIICLFKLGSPVFTPETPVILPLASKVMCMETLMVFLSSMVVLSPLKSGCLRQLALI